MITKDQLVTETYHLTKTNHLAISCEFKVVTHKTVDLSTPKSEEHINRIKELCEKEVLQSLYGELMMKLEVALLKASTNTVSSNSLQATVIDILRKYHEETK